MKNLIVRFLLLFVFVEFTTAAIFNSSFLDANEPDDDVLAKNTGDIKTRRAAKKKAQSTSSSRERRYKDSKNDRKESLSDSDGISDSESFGHEAKKKKDDRYKLKSSKERKGWHKYHRKCTPCPREMRKKWRDPSINWICGAYQRARRSFKSICMMHYRNCQDGTMFVYVSDHRCANSSKIMPHGDHFMYDYKVKLSGESSDSSSSEDTDTSTSDSKWDSSKSLELKLAQDAMGKKYNVL